MALLQSQPQNLKFSLGTCTDVVQTCKLVTADTPHTLLSGSNAEGRPS